MTMRAARVYGYNEPLRLEEIPVPAFGDDEVLVKVGAAGVCRTDFQLMDGYFKEALPLEFPVTPGHEISGWVAAVGKDVPRSAGLDEGNLIVVDGSWGEGACRQCHLGNEQLCSNGRWAGFGLHGGFEEYLPVPFHHIINVPALPDLTPQTLAPLTDAGLTTYRGMKKLRAAGVLGPGRTVAVTGIGGLGSYGVQYAKLLGAGATVVAFARSDDKLAVAKTNGAEHIINTRDKTVNEVRAELEGATGRPELNAVLDCAGTKESVALGFALLTTQGAITSVGLIGQQVEVPLFSLVGREFSYFGSFWGNYEDLTEVLSLASKGKIKHTVNAVDFDDVNDTITAIARGDIVGRSVIVYD